MEFSKKLDEIRRKYPIKKELVFGGKTVVLLAVDVKDIQENSRSNILLYNGKGNLLWVVELPEDYTLHIFYDDMEVVDQKLVAWCASTLCEIDLNSGKIINMQFIR